MSAWRDRRALVTGGADGIGLALARGMAEQGARVALLDIRADAARAAAESLPGAIALGADVSDPASLAGSAGLLEDAWGGLDALWINAGVATPTRVADVRPEQLNWLYGVNVLGLVWTAQAFLPLLRRGEAPALGVTLSSAALVPPSGFSLYGASKHAAMGLAEALRSDLEPEGISVTLFCPGLLATGIWDAARARPDRFGGPRHGDPAHARRWLEAEPPQDAAAKALEVMQAGGGYAIHVTEPATIDVFERRTAALRAAMGQT